MWTRAIRYLPAGGCAGPGSGYAWLRAVISIEENLAMAGLRGKRRGLGLEDRLSTTVGTLSGGQVCDQEFAVDRMFLSA